MGDAGMFPHYRGFFTALRERVAEMKNRENHPTKPLRRCAMSFAQNIRTGTNRCVCHGRDGNLRQLP
jgi:hypothetical protein